LIEKLKTFKRGDDVEDMFFQDLRSLEQDERNLSFFHSIIESSYDAIIGEALDGTVLSWNNAAEKIYGYKSNEMLGKSIFNIIPDYKKEEFRDILKKINNGEIVQNIITERIKKNGNKIYLYLSMSPIRDKYGNIIAISGVARDITELKTMEMELRESNERFKTFIENMPALIYLKDKFTRNIIMSKKFENILELPFEDLSGKTNEEIWGRELGHDITIEDMKVLRLKQGSFLEKEEIINTNGEERTYITYKFPIHQESGKHFIGGISLDVTKGKKYERELECSYEELSAVYEELTATEEELREQYNALKESQKLLNESQRRYKLAVEGANDGIWDMDIMNKKIFVSDGCKNIFDVNIEGNIFDIYQWENCIYKKSGYAIFDKLRDYLKKDLPFYSDDIKILTESGQERYIYFRGKVVRNEEGQPLYMAGSVTDNTDRKKNEKIIENLAYLSTTTGLYNRTYVMSKFPSLLKEIECNNEKAALIFVDIDNFKSINDTMGHLEGDEFLKKISGDFVSIIKDIDYACHLGGDEFLFLIRKVNTKNEIEQFVKNLLSLFKKPFVVREQYIYYITASIGITMMPDYGYDLQTLFNHSDDAMYYAKRNGKNNYKFYKDIMSSNIYEETKLLNELKSALYNDEFKVFYQPKVKADTGEILGMEALVRWQKQDGTVISPSQFINFAEKRGIIVSIGEYVMKEACRQNKLWQQKGLKPLRIAVNLSTCQLADENLFDKIQSTLEETGLSPNYLEVEITETMIMKNFEISTNTLNKLRSIGVKVSLDDFGTGYSSLNYLKKLPIDCVKIDKFFIDNIILDPKERFMANSLINLFHGIGLTVVAEGVEHLDQLELLKEYRCDEIQGYYFSKPVNARDFEKIIKYIK
jgi:diguanylate cyclase (GGDEF)-like protein/PAS domain S-box-containing protein